MMLQLFCHTALMKKTKKIVPLLSTTHNIPDANQTVKIHEMVSYYNKNKGGMDVHNRLCKNYTALRNSKWWTLALFYGILNIAEVNSYILWSNNEAEASTSESSTSGTSRKRAEAASPVACSSQSTTTSKKPPRRKDFLVSIAKKRMRSHLEKRLKITNLFHSSWKKSSEKS